MFSLNLYILHETILCIIFDTLDNVTEVWALSYFFLYRTIIRTRKELSWIFYSNCMISDKDLHTFLEESILNNCKIYLKNPGKDAWWWNIFIFYTVTLHFNSIELYMKATKVLMPMKVICQCNCLCLQF